MGVDLQNGRASAAIRNCRSRPDAARDWQDAPGPVRTNTGGTTTASTARGCTEPERHTSNGAAASRVARTYGRHNAMMRYACVAVAAMLSFAVPAYADWQTVTSPDGRYSVSFPEAPKASAMSNAAFEAHSFVLQQTNLTLVAGYKDYKPGTALDVQQELQTNRDALVSASQATLKSSGDAALTRGVTPVPAEMFSFVQGTAVCDSLVAVDNLRVYQLIACHPADSTASDTDRFLKSFTLTAN